MSKKIFFVTSLLLASSALLAGCVPPNLTQESSDSAGKGSIESNQDQSDMPELSSNDLPTLENDLNEFKLEPETFE